MKVILKAIGETDYQKLVVTDGGETDHHPGEVTAYRCGECKQIDETRQQIWHREDCSHAGEDGRAYYADLEPEAPPRPAPELDADHPVYLIEAGVPDRATDVHNANKLAYLCACGNADETLFEIVHDEACPLAGQFGRAQEDAPDDVLEVIAADGGQSD